MISQFHSYDRCSPIARVPRMVVRLRRCERCDRLFKIKCWFGPGRRGKAKVCLGCCNHPHLFLVKYVWLGYINEYQK